MSFHMMTMSHTVLNNEYLHKQFPGSSNEMTGARPNQAITQVFEGLLFNNEHLGHCDYLQ